jgi:hypothetical protein
MTSRCFEATGDHAVWTVGSNEISGSGTLRLAALPKGRFVHLRGAIDYDYISAPWPEWRNGRRNGLKIRRGQPHESSTLSSGIPNPVNRLFT